MVSPSKSDLAYRAEDDHRTLTRAAEVQADAVRMKAVAKHHRKAQKELAGVGRVIGGSGGRLAKGRR
jgi:hypothetical protein